MPRNEVPTESIPEVMDYTEAKEMLEAFKEAHSKVFASYDILVEQLNQKMEAADKAVRSRKVSCGDWDLFRVQKRVDAEALFNAVGMNTFLQLGGSTTTKTIYNIDRKMVESAAARGDIPKDVADESLIDVPMYHAPKALR